MIDITWQHVHSHEVRIPTFWEAFTTLELINANRVNFMILISYFYNVSILHIKDKIHISN